jgi:DNA-binding MarR family transcriptional regulator
VVAELDPIIHQPTRLRIMVLLYQNRQAAATWVRDALGLTDGNLGSHTQKLVDAGYLEQGRALSAQGFQLRLKLTPKGEQAFAAYLAGLKSMLAAATPADPSTPAARE